MSDTAYTLKDTDFDESFIHRADMDTPDISKWGEEAIAQLNAMQLFIDKLNNTGIGRLDTAKLKHLARASVMPNPDEQAKRDFKVFLQLAKYGQIYSQINTKYRATIWPLQRLEKQFKQLKQLKHTLDTNGVANILIDAYNVYQGIVGMLSKKRVDVRGTKNKKDDFNIDTNNAYKMIAQDTSDYDSYDSFANKVAMPDKNKGPEVSPERLAELVCTYADLYQAAVVGSQTAATEQDRSRYNGLIGNCKRRYDTLNNVVKGLATNSPDLYIRFLKSYIAQNPTWETPEAIKQAREFIASKEGNKR